MPKLPTENTKKYVGDALVRYKARTGHELAEPKAVLFDMDGVLYDSMPLHARAWKMMCDEAGITCTPDEFFAYEGMTGAATIDLLVRRQWNRPATDEEKTGLYAVKSRYFKSFGAPAIMPGAHLAVGAADVYHYRDRKSVV